MKDFFENLYYKLYYRGIRRLIPKYRDRTIFTKFFWRTWWDRRTKGFDESCTWSLDYSLAKLIAPRLKMFMEFTDSSVPEKIMTEVKNEMIAKGKPFDTYKYQFKNKSDRKYCFKEASKRWMNILNDIYEAFNDIIEEGKDFNKWSKKYQPLVDKHNKKLKSLKTEKEKKAYWDSIIINRKYRTGITFTDYDLSYIIKEKGLSLFAEYFENLWW